jgi:Ca-activated chloride channel family protein
MPNMTRLPATIGILASLAAIIASTPAAAATGKLTGYVLDQSGNPLSGVAVEARLKPNGPARRAFSNEDGAFRFDGLTPGNYRVQASAPKLRTVIRDDVLVSANGVAEVNLIMEVRTRTEEVAVVEKAPIVATSTPNVQERFDVEFSEAPPQEEHRPRFNTEAYAHLTDNPFLATREDPRSTFSIDVDTAAYANVRRFIEGGTPPPVDAVRIEELINYFPYRYPPPTGEAPVGVTVEVNDCPWNSDSRLVRIGLRARDVTPARRPASNLVFLIDVSGSMSDDNKLPLVKRSLRLLLDSLAPRDRVALVVYAGNSGLVLPSTPASERNRILAAIEQLEAGGSTNGGQGIELAYQVASRGFIKGGNNRVLLATDGDFNVGVTSHEALMRLIEDKARSGVFLTVLGFGMGNLKDATMETLADRGNGNYSYIDSVNEARKVLGEQLAGTLLTVAKDVKLQVEFNPARVAVYRLIGYENRLLRHQDFDDDTKDAGEIGAGHTVTALYQVVPASGAARLGGDSPEILTLKMRYKRPDGWFSRKLEWAMNDRGAHAQSASADFKFAAAVAAFGMILRGSPHLGTADHDMVLRLAGEGLGEDPAGYRRAFVDLVKKSKQLQPAKPAAQSRS